MEIKLYSQLTAAYYIQKNVIHGSCVIFIDEMVRYHFVIIRMCLENKLCTTMQSIVNVISVSGVIRQRGQN